MQQRYSIDRFRRPFHDFLRDQSNGGVVLFMAVLVAMVRANSPWKDSYQQLW